MTERDASCTRPLRSTPGFSVGLFLAGLGGVALADLLVDGRMTGLDGQQDLAGGYLRLTPSTNDGIAFGLLRDTGPLPILLALMALVVLARFAWTTRCSRWNALALGLLAGGAVANVVERLRMGTVLDYLDLGFGATRWPTFNVADVGIPGRRDPGPRDGGSRQSRATTICALSVISPCCSDGEQRR